MAAIFDMDGLLLDTEPLWGVSMLKVAEQYQVPVGPDFFKYTTGLRIYEVTEFWKEKFQRNVMRDLASIHALEGAGWNVFTIWECHLKNDPETLERLMEKLRFLESELSVR